MDTTDIKNDDEKNPPLHMDKWARNARLYKTLTEMGLFCSPIFIDNDRNKIESISVSVDVLSSSDVNTPVKGPKITKVVTASRDNGSNVINLPPVL